MKGDRKDISSQPEGIPESEASPGRTIVGGRPPEERKVLKNIPVGIQKLLLETGTEDEELESMAADPFKAAEGKGITLTESEKLILLSTTPEQLKAMAGNIRTPRLERREFIRQSAAAVALAAGSALMLPEIARAEQLLAQNEMSQIQTRGITLDTPSIDWKSSLDDALKEAVKTEKPVMAIFFSKSGSSEKVEEAEKTSEELCSFQDNRLKRSFFTAKLVGAQIRDTVKARRFNVTKYPTVLFLTPKGEVFMRAVQPVNEEQLIEMMQSAGDKYKKQQ
ncbi:MAG: twin-arginine translocation signal domain-containing protein [Vulcanimicrobiota bacterium]